MADNDEQIEIQVEPEKKGGDPEIQVVAADESAGKAGSRDIAPEDGLESLRQQLEKERATRIEMERRAREFAQTAYLAKNEAQDSNLHLVSNAIETVKQQTEILKSNYSAAMSSGDYDRAAEIQQAMSGNSAKLLQLEQGKQALEAMPKQQAPQPVGVSDPVEALASQLSPRSAAWIRKNPHFATDPRQYQKMLAAHNLATADGIQPDTDEYFDAVESTLRMRRSEPVASDDPMADAAKPTQRHTPPPVAPVSRSGAGPGSRPNTVRLTSQEREMASMMGMTVEEYAKNKLALQKEGKLN
jgi:hypothetical protein